MPGPIITLTTDFGNSDYYVGAVKGVILSLNPEATIIDITHQVPPQDIQSGAFILGEASAFFPSNTIHIAVIDPGVGTNRRPILIHGPDGIYLGPDNGLFSYLFPHSSESTPFAMTQTALPEHWYGYHITNRAYWNKTISHTFHGRDIFAPVAGHLSRGITPDLIGVPTATITAFHIPAPFKQGSELHGIILQSDHFGNLITNIKAAELESFTSTFLVEIGGIKIEGISTSYQEARFTALIGSHGYLEIAVQNGNAQNVLGVDHGAPVRISYK